MIEINSIFESLWQNMDVFKPEEPLAPEVAWDRNAMNNNYLLPQIDGTGARALTPEFQTTLPEHIAAYEITRVERTSLKEPEVTDTGAHIYQELCSFYDNLGHVIVREATIAIPNSNLVETIPYPAVATDPWLTGKRGLNRIKIRELVDMGYPVIWLHHADHRSPLQKNKSVTRSARHTHALLDNLEPSADFDLANVIGDGYSRGGMTGEKFIALSPQHGRKVIFSIFDAPCFAEDMPQIEKNEILLKQLPREARNIGSLAIRHFMRGLQQRDFSDFIEFSKTANLHPKNLVHELMWGKALANAQVGAIIEHQPRNTAGIRNFFEHDEMSQLASYVDIYAQLANVVVVAHDGAHTEGASPEYVYVVRRAQFKNLGKVLLSGEAVDAEVIAQRAEIDLRSLSLV